MVRRSSRWLAAVVTATLCIAPGAARAGAEDAAFRSVSSIHLASDLRPEVSRMLAGSPSFRAQWQIVATTPGLLVRVRIDPGLHGSAVRGRTVIGRLEGGLRLAIVDLAPFGSRVEWIAHEFEHIIEQIEGSGALQGADRDAASRAGVWRTGEQMFETHRAIHAGRRVVQELAEIEQSDKNVE